MEWWLSFYLNEVPYKGLFQWGLLVVCGGWVCVSENVFILLSFLKNSFIRYIFYFKADSYILSVHWRQHSNVLWLLLLLGNQMPKKNICIPICCCFSLLPFKILSVFGLLQFHFHLSGMILFLLLRIHWTSTINKNCYLLSILKNSQPLLFNNYLTPPVILISFWNSN